MADKIVNEYYQSIPELGIKGRFDLEEQFEAIGLPKDLSGWSVMDVGCNIGGFLVECVKRGADDIMGIEPNQLWRLIAWGVINETVPDRLNNRPLFMESIYNVGVESDLSLLLSVTHVCEGITGQELLDETWKYTDKLMIVEINHRLQKEPIKLPEGAKVYGRNKDGRTVYHVVKDNE